MKASMRLLQSATTIRTSRATTATIPSLFDYTRGRFLFNEDHRMRERHLTFFPDELSKSICIALKRNRADLQAIDKFAEGGFNRIIRATFNDGLEILARLPFKMEAPLHHSVASEVATLAFLRNQGLPVPQVHGYSTTSDNSVGTEFILLEKLEGRPLSDEWFYLPNKTIVKVMKQLVALEQKWLSLRLPAHGSLYFRHDLPSGYDGVRVDCSLENGSELVVGPSAAYAWWYRERANLDVARGPWTDYQSCFEAVAEREKAFCTQHGKLRLNAEPSLRERQDFKLQDPQSHAQLLDDYLKLAPGLAIDNNHRFARPTLRHPDFSPGNVLVNDDYEITGIIDWQHTVILPLALCAGIPKHYQNWGDWVSETLQKPATQLPDDFDRLDEEAQATAKETMRRRLVHFFYAGTTMKLSEDHFDALRAENVMLRAKLFDRAAAPWEGNSLDLEHILMEVARRWPMAIDDDDKEPSPGPHSGIEAPVHYSDERVEACSNAMELQEEKEQELEEMREVIGIDSQGWVPDEERLEHAKRVRDLIKEKLLEECETEKERIAIREHFSFDGHAE